MKIQVLQESEASSSLVAKQFTYIDLGKKCTFGECFAFSSDPSIKKLIDPALMKTAYNISLQTKETKGRARKELKEEVQKFQVMERQAKIEKFNNKKESLYGEIGILHDELQEWKSRCKNLEEEKGNIYEEIVLEAKQSERKSREQLNKCPTLRQLDGNFEGVKEGSVETVFKEHISEYLKQKPVFHTIDNKIKIKINGDGTRMTRNSNFITAVISNLC